MDERDLADLETRAAAGDAEAQYKLAHKLHLGDELPRNDDRAASLLENAAAQGHAFAAHSLGHMLASGVLPTVDRDRARILFEQAAAGGVSKAWFRLGQLCEEGVGDEVANDPFLTQAIYCYRRGAEAGDPDCQFRLAQLHRSGRGMPRDTDAAVRLIEQAAQGGQIEAQFTLSLIFDTGAGHLPKDPRQAHTWCLAAADQGYLPALIKAASDFSEGNGVAPSPERALEYATRAAEAGEQLERLIGVFSAED